MDELEFHNYKKEYAEDFKQLNLEWIDKHFVVEEHDLEQLSHPKEYIINNGGEIVFAIYDEKIIGTCALVKTGEQEFEMAKMAISPNYRGMQLGYKLGIKIVERAKELGAKRIWLESSKRLAAAVPLYIKMGFKEIPIDYSPYARADIRMELFI